MPAYTTIYKSAKQLAAYESSVIKRLGRTLSLAGFIQCDNVQNYLRQRDQRMGRVNQLNIGLAGTFCELSGVDASALDLQDKLDRVRLNERANVTVKSLLGLIDQPHLERVCSLHWLKTLVNRIPELAEMKAHISMLFETRAAKIKLEVKATKVHPLQSNAKNESKTAELKEGLLDFLAQLGQTEGDYDKRLHLIGGDGLTYQKILELQRHLQLHDDALQSFSVVTPVLAPWHLEWTDVNRIFELFLGKPLDPDPSTIAHSTNLIGRNTVFKDKKIDYNAGVDTMYTVLDARMLDCWRYSIFC
jgi:hypothetical protein